MSLPYIDDASCKISNLSSKNISESSYRSYPHPYSLSAFNHLNIFQHSRVGWGVPINTRLAFSFDRGGAL